jgi:hypothetical protein
MNQTDFKWIWDPQICRHPGTNELPNYDVDPNYLYQQMVLGLDLAGWVQHAYIFDADLPQCKSWRISGIRMIHNIMVATYAHIARPGYEFDHHWMNIQCKAEQFWGLVYFAAYEVAEPMDSQWVWRQNITKGDPGFVRFGTVRQALQGENDGDKTVYGNGFSNVGHGFSVGELRVPGGPNANTSA